MAWVPGYNFRQKITIAAQTHILADLTDQTVAVHISSANGSFWLGEDGNGSFIRFALINGTLLKFQVESYDVLGKDAWFHVKIPTLSASVATEIYIYYNTPFPVAGDDKQNTWDANFVAVYHLNQDQTEGAFDDATANNNDFINTGTTDAAAQIDRGRAFNGSNQRLKGATNNWPVVLPVTLEAVVYFAVDQTGSNHDYVMHASGWNSGVYDLLAIARVAPNNELGYIENGVGIYGPVTAPTATETHIIMQFNPTVPYVECWVDGVAKTINQPGGALTHLFPKNSLGVFNIDQLSLWFHYFQGHIDEATVSNSGRGGDWAAARNQSRLGTWLTLGAQETNASLSGTITGISSLSGSANVSYQAAGTIAGISSLSATVIIPGQAPPFFKGKSLLFAGADPGTPHYVRISNHSDFSGMTKGTFACWFRPTATINSSSPYQVLIARNYGTPHVDDYWLGFGLLNGNTGRLEFACQNGPSFVASARTSWTAGTWYFVVATFDSTANAGAGEARIYVNGVLDSTAASFNPIGANTGSEPLYIGANEGDIAGVKNYFQGNIDETRIYKDRVLTLTEISNMYNGTALPTETSLVLMCDFNDNVRDHSGNGHDGTLVGASYSTLINNQENTWPRRQKITVGSSAHISVDETNFPVSIHIPSTNTDFWANTADKRELRITDSDGVTLLEFDIESFDDIGNDAWLNVKVPTLTAAADPFIYLYYGNKVSGRGDFKESVWDANFAFVAHLNIDNPSGLGDDATFNNNNLTDSGSTDIASQIDRGRNFAASAYMDAPDSASLDITGAMTISFWFKPTIAIAGNPLAKFDNASGNNRSYLMGNFGVDRLGFYLSGDGTSVNRAFRVNATAMAPGTTYFFAGVYVPSTNIDVYLNGSLDNGTLTGTIQPSTFNSTASLRLAQESDGSNAFTGVIDEVRISNVARSADWIAAEYQSGLGTWLSFGAAENVLLPLNLTGTVAGGSAMAAAAVAQRGVSGSISGTTSVAGLAGNIYGISGTVTGLSTLSGITGLNIPLNAYTGGTAALTGATYLALGATGSYAGLSAASGGIGLQWAVSGLALGVSALAGTLSLAGGAVVFASGALLALSAINGNVVIDYSLPGSTALGVSNLSGTLFSQGTLSLTGAITATSNLTGLADSTLGFSGSSPALSSLSGVASRNVAVFGQAAALGAMGGSINLVAGARGSITAFTSLGTAANISKGVVGALSGLSFLTAAITGQRVLNIHSQMDVLSTLAGGVAMGYGLGGSSLSGLILTGDIFEIISCGGYSFGTSSVTGSHVITGPFSPTTLRESPGFDVTRYGGRSSPTIQMDSPVATVTQDNNNPRVTR